MMSLPKDNVMLLSVVNTKLRDFYSSLSALCGAEDESEADIKARLASIGYTYDAEINQFV